MFLSGREQPTSCLSPATAAVNIALYTLMPFCYTAVPRDQHTGQDDIGTGPLGAIGNILWLVFAGWWLALGHLVAGVLLCLTIIGIPFAIQHLKMVPLALFPFGRELR